MTVCSLEIKYTTFLSTFPNFGCMIFTVAKLQHIYLRRYKEILYTTRLLLIRYCREITLEKHATKHFSKSQDIHEVLLSRLCFSSREKKCMRVCAGDIRECTGSESLQSHKDEVDGQTKLLNKKVKAIYLNYNSKYDFNTTSYLRCSIFQLRQNYYE